MTNKNSEMEDFLLLGELVGLVASDMNSIRKLTTSAGNKDSIKYGVNAQNILKNAVKGRVTPPTEIDSPQPQPQSYHKTVEKNEPDNDHLEFSFMKELENPPLNEQGVIDNSSFKNVVIEKIKNSVNQLNEVIELLYKTP